MEKAPIVTLQNGLRVCNFSSPHPFTFEDGSVLPGCDAERTNALMLNAREELKANPYYPNIKDIELRFEMSIAVRSELEQLYIADFDVLIVPLPVLQAMKAAGMEIGKARTCRLADRVRKTVCADKFCI